VSNHIFVGNTRVASVVKHTEEKQPATYFYASDHLGSSSVLTNNAGSYHERIEYLPYGETWVEDKVTSDSYTTPYKFTGKELDTETGLYYFGARYYDARVSRWISADPALADGKYFPKPNDFDTEHDFYWYLQQDGSKKLAGLGGVFNAVNMDVYHYAGNNPVKLVDPDGEVLDIGIDIAFIGYDIYSLSTNEGYKDWINWAALGGDIVGAVTPFVTGVGAGIRTAKAVDKAVDTTKAAVKCNSIKAGKVVLGKFPDYIKLGNELNAKIFNIPAKIWDKMNDAERWTANKKFLDRVIAKGDEIILSNPIKNVKDATGTFRKELEYLESKGYKLSDDGTKMIMK